MAKSDSIDAGPETMGVLIATPSQELSGQQPSITDAKSSAYTGESLLILRHGPAP